MNVSYKWLKDFTDFDLSPTQLRDLITARAVTVDDLEVLRSDLKDVVVGLVVEVVPHPNSEHLNLTKVDAGGDELLSVVCGAPNVTAGVKYPFAPIGATLPGDFKIEKRKIRGESSNGMLCSARELWLGLDHEGILPIVTDAAPGTKFLSIYDAGDTRLILDVGANRPDALSHEGVAREIAAATGNALRRPSVEGYDAIPQVVRVDRSGTVGGVTVTVDDKDGAPLYIGLVIRGVQVGPSPEWLVSRLDGAGVRSISNVVDATNYVLHGLGHPLHAFDLSKIAGNAVVVRKAAAGEAIRTLDGIDRKLTDTMTVIADAEKAQAIAGVMGASTSEISDSTTDIFLEVAVFNAQRVRNTRKKIGVSTDASYRFERAMDAHAAEEVARYAAALIISLAGGAVDGAPLMIGDALPPQAKVSLRPSRVTKVLGDAVSGAECVSLLNSVGFKSMSCSPSGDCDIIAFEVPSWRADVTQEIDLIEEIARLRGYDSFSNDLRPFRVGNVPDSPAYLVGKRVTETLVSAGYFEVRPIPFVADAGEKGVKLTNPMAENEGMLRSDLISTLGKRVEYNFSHMVSNIRLFEVGVAFENTKTHEGLPTERTMAAVVLTGDRYPAHFTDAKPPQLDIWDARNVAQVVVDAAYGINGNFGKRNAFIQASNEDGAPSSAGVQFLPNQVGDGWTITLDGSAIGRVGAIELDSPVWASPVFGVEIDITPAFTGSKRYPVYKALPTTPSTEFDLALLVSNEQHASDVEAVLRAAAGDLLESLALFDEFKGKGVPEGFRSLAWRLTLRHPDRTLRDKEIEGRRTKILQTLEKELGIKQRAS